MNDVQGGGIVIGSVGGNLSFQAGGDIVAGNKTIINKIIQRIAKELTTTPYKFLASYEIADRHRRPTSRWPRTAQVKPTE
jgi:hypothetical protein